MLLGILLAILLGLVVWRMVELRNQAQTSSTTPTTKLNRATIVSPTSGNDNQSLSTDLSTVNNGLNNASQAQTDANTAINDQQQEVNVTTN